MTANDLTGTKLQNRYKVLEKIGAGGMSVVWKAYDLVLDRNVALKVLRPEMSEDESFIVRFKREAKAAASLTHPNIVSIYDVGQDGGLYFIVMELVEGETLRDKLRRQKRLDLREALEIAAQVCRGLAHAHANKIIHRDIKPQNILITRDGHVKVADFGIARALGSASNTATDVVVGSAPYISPEQARNGDVSARSDLYSLGCVLYEMLAGEPPFSGDSPVAIALQHLEKEAPSVRSKEPSVPIEVDELVAKALAKKPEDRFQSADDMLKAINGVLSTARLSFEAKGDGDVERRKDRKAKGRSMSLATKLLLGLVAIVAVLGGYVLWTFYRWMSVPIVEVPNVVGLPQVEAQAVLRSAGFIPQLSAEVYDKTVPANVVISQNPEAGAKCRKGREVYYTISKGQQYSKVPDVRGKTLREAELELVNAGLSVRNTTFVYHPTVPKDKVISQNPREGTEVAIGTVVDLEISKGAEPMTAKVPQLVGLTKEQAEKALTDALLQLGTVTPYPDNQPLGTVISQDPQEGAEVPVRSKVNIVISLGPKKPDNQYTAVIQVPNKGKPVNVRITVLDIEGESVKYDKNEAPGSVITVTFTYKGPQAVMKTYFDGELAGQTTIRP